MSVCIFPWGVQSKLGQSAVVSKINLEYAAPGYSEKQIPGVTIVSTGGSTNVSHEQTCNMSSNKN